MWLEEADGFAEIFKGYLPFYLFVALPIFILMSPVSPVAASHEFSVYRMQQYDLHNVPHGCRSASFNLEGRSLTSWSTSRHCVVARMQDITIEQFMEIRNKAGALLLVLPKNDTVLSDEEKEHIQLLEMAMSQQEMTAPVYFAHWTPDLDGVIEDLQHSFITDEKSGTALEAMFNTVSSNGYQIVVSAPTPSKLESNPVTLYGKLSGRPGSTNTIVIAAHYDAAGIVPELAEGADSNASGAVAVLELARIFSRLYSDPATRGGTSLVFVLTSTGHSLNYFSAKKWIEEQLDSTDGSLLQDVSFAINLDSISSPKSLNAHVSRPPRGGAPLDFLTRLAATQVHKKINLADEALAWQHERFSIRRMSAFTLSTLQTHKDPSRSSILDKQSDSNLNQLVTNIERIARALASHVYNVSDGTDEFNELIHADESAVKHWYQYLADQPRPPHVVTTQPPNAGISGALHRALSRYVECQWAVHAADRREPEYTLYGPTAATLYVYSVKPAVFDLILTLAIVAYLTLVYFAIQLFPMFYEEYARLVTGKPKVN